MLPTLQIETGSLDQVACILKVFGAAAGTPARIAAGMAELPLNAAVETEMTVALHN
jgi:hypothetical protein